MRPNLFTISMLLLSALPFEGAVALEAPSVDFADPQTMLFEQGDQRFNLNVEMGAARRFGAEARVIVIAGVPDALEVSLSQRATVGVSDADDGTERATELRIGRGLLREYEANASGSSAYAFVASNNDAVTWRPDARSAFGGRGDALVLQNRVEVGDLAAGVTYERNGVQASLAYVEREESARIGRESFSQDQRFTGVTITMRR